MEEAHMSTSSPWPNGRSGCVSLSFDDGHRSQLSTAIPALERHDLRGTFYVNPRDDYVEWLKPWRDVHARGHEIGNHRPRVRPPSSKIVCFSASLSASSTLNVARMVRFWKGPTVLMRLESGNSMMVSPSNFRALPSRPGTQSSVPLTTP
ncbi:MAG: polysaccharide deacetylase family protein [Candidatus Poribacteria bacterium]